MYKQATLLFFHAETSIHAGSGESSLGIDLAIQRERHTEYPVIAASGVKGALRDWFSQDQRYPPGTTEPAPEVKAAFGPDTNHASEHAGAVTTTDARLLLFPIRTAKGVFAWTTSPLALARLRRDLQLANSGIAEPPAFDSPYPQGDRVFGSAGICDVVDSGQVLLEEYDFAFEPHAEVANLARWLISNAKPTGSEYDYWRNNLEKRLLVLPDAAFRDFVVHSTEVQARVKLNEHKTTTGEGGNLFYQENLPADSLLYAAILATDDLSPQTNFTAGELLIFLQGFDNQRIQLGGDETTGKGYCCAHFLPAPSTPPES